MRARLGQARGRWVAADGGVAGSPQSEQERRRRWRCWRSAGAGALLPEASAGCGAHEDGAAAIGAEGLLPASKSFRSFERGMFHGGGLEDRGVRFVEEPR